ncbi:hypothetical protein DVH26_10500 [Paenibacillus sp. H1-7]|nr:hypothetical protein [Paenibacillus sp. H1-7]ULL14838.1 hypothetical protein DVH26_10500 [Paenibacillus sp. H1-7]
MRVWRLGYKEEIYTFTDMNDYRKHLKNGFVGKSMKENWIPFPVELINDRVQLYDFTTLGSP